MNQFCKLRQIALRVFGDARVGSQIGLLDVGDPQFGSIVEDANVVGRDHLSTAFEPVNQRLGDSSSLRKTKI